jgi:cysteinyl-tRNA synthetase
LHPDDAAWASGGSDERLSHAVDVLVAGLLEQRAQARSDKDWSRADAIRDQLKAAGLEIEDTPDGPKWSL